MNYAQSPAALLISPYFAALIGIIISIIITLCPNQIGTIIYLTRPQGAHRHQLSEQKRLLTQPHKPGLARYYGQKKRAKN